MESKWKDRSNIVCIGIQSVQYVDPQLIMPETIPRMDR